MHSRHFRLPSACLISFFFFVLLNSVVVWQKKEFSCGFDYGLSVIFCDMLLVIGLVKLENDRKN